VANNPPDSETSKNKLVFPQLIQGKMNVEDYVFIGTHNLETYFGPDRLQKLITTRSPEESCQQFERILGSLKNDLSFGGLILSLQKIITPEEQIPTKHYPTKGSAESIQQLFTTEKNTAQTLSSSLYSRLNEKLKTGLEQLHKNDEATTTPRAQTLFAKPQQVKINSSHSRPYQDTPLNSRTNNPPHKKDIIGQIIKVTVILATYFGKALLWLFLILWRGISAFFSTFYLAFIALINYKDRRKTIVSNWKNQWRSYKESFIHLPLFTKILLSASGLLVLTFLGSIWYIKHTQKIKTQISTYGTQVQAIKNKQASAESALIYNDETRARQELADAQTLLTSLSCTKKDEKKTCDELQSHSEDIQSKLRKIYILKPELLATWNTPASSPITGLVKINNKLIGFNAEQNSLSTYDVLTKETNTQTSPSTTSGFTIAGVPKENDYVLLVNNQKDLWQFNPQENTFKQFDVTYPEENSTLASVAVFNRRLYALDTAHNQIYRHDNIKGGFALGKEWVKDVSVDIKDGASFTIDGDIFVLKKNGEIIKLTKGLRQDFSIKNLDPKLSQGGKIWTYTDLKYLYILDTSNKRLLILDKEGNLIHQLVASEFEAPTDMVIDEENKIGYIIDKNKVYKINLPI
jgi:hypothetical protein